MLCPFILSARKVGLPRAPWAGATPCTFRAVWAAGLGQLERDPPGPHEASPAMVSKSGLALQFYSIVERNHPAGGPLAHQLHRSSPGRSSRALSDREKLPSDKAGRARDGSDRGESESVAVERSDEGDAAPSHVDLNPNRARPKTMSKVRVNRPAREPIQVHVCPRPGPSAGLLWLRFPTPGSKLTSLGRVDPHFAAHPCSRR